MSNEFELEPTPICDSCTGSADRFGDRDVIPASIARRLEKELAIKERLLSELKRAMPIPDKRGVQFGNAWLSYDKMLGFCGQESERELFYSSDGIACSLIEWANKLARIQK